MGGEKKLTTMVIKVDLDCHKCRKKIKKVLCKIPQIQNQLYNEKENFVMITVLCCSPEKVMEKIACKGGATVKGIEIVKPPPPPKPKEQEKPKEKPKEVEKPKEAEKKPAGPPPVAKPAPAPEKPKDNNNNKPKTVVIVEQEKPKQPGPSPAPKPQLPPPSQADQIPMGLPPPAPAPMRYCCRECYEGYGVGPCYSMQGPASYEGYGRPVYDSWGGGYRGGYYPSRGECFSDDNTSGCVVM